MPTDEVRSRKLAVNVVSVATVVLTQRTVLASFSCAAADTKMQLQRQSFSMSQTSALAERQTSAENQQQSLGHHGVLPCLQIVPAFSIYLIAATLFCRSTALDQSAGVCCSPKTLLQRFHFLTKNNKEHNLRVVFNRDDGLR